MHHIYIITNIITSKQYVGLTKNLESRWKQHRKMNGSAKYLHASIKKHGIESFLFTHIADAFTLESAQTIERVLISERNTKFPHGYNLTDGGEGIIGFVFSEESKQKMRNSAKGQTRSKESNEKRRIAMLGNKHGLGKKHTEEHKMKIGIASTGKKHTEEAKAKMKAAIAIRKAQKELI
jgi:group I intron endonuclease